MKKLLLLIGIVFVTFSGCSPYIPLAEKEDTAEVTTETYATQSTADANVKEKIAQARSRANGRNSMPEDRMAVQERDAEHKQYTQPDQAADVINANFYKVSASSQLDDQGTHNYSPYNVIDGSTETAWVEGVSGTGEGEWISLQSDIPQTVHRIGIYNGYGENDTVYNENGKLNSAMITFSDNTSEIIYFDTSVKGGFEYFDIEEKVTTSVTITLLSCDSGTKYDDTCISEIRIY